MSTATRCVNKLQVGAKVFQDLPSDNVIRSNCISAVMVTAEIGPFSRKGSRVDVTVSALDDARSLQGGTLIFTPLRGADGETYVTAQGPLSVGGFLVVGTAAAAQKNHTNVGRIPGGGLVEKEALGEIACNGFIRLLLREPDYTTAQAIARAINLQYPHAAQPIDAGTVQVAVPKSRCADVVGFAGEIGTLEVNPDFPARVVIDERTGTVVAGEDVRISRVAVAHGNLALIRVETPEVAQPPPLTPGPPVVVPRTQVGAAEQRSYLQVVPATVNVGSLARALNALGVTPRDLISIFQALKEAGALHADLVIM
jgi:flagellar P-ring protein precursor FlgI